MREPLFLMQGSIQTGKKGNNNNSQRNKLETRPATNDDIEHCNKLCTSVHGFARERELHQAIAQRVAAVVERDGEITGYSTGIGILCYSVGKTNDDLKALIGNAEVILGPGFFVPGRNHELLTWLLDSGFRIAWPANLMSIGNYQEPKGAFIPSLAY